jgi:hypothetical protein
MEKMARVAVYMEDAVYITSCLNDFDGGVQKWKNAVYDMFRWDMTYSFAYKIDVIESRSSGVFILLICRPKFEESIVATMEDNGFRNIKVRHEDVGHIECTEFPEDMLIDFAIVDY